MKPILMRAVLCGMVQVALQLPAARSQSPPPDLTALNIEDLMNIDVTSASKKEQKLSRVPAAIFVITQEDIRRSAATNLPDLLRMVPGMDVAQITPSTWAISARGFNGQYSNKLLVLVDGRTVYTPEFAGVFWDALDVPVDLIERIEVIRGPGAAVWGANAVNGVIDIITKTAQETQSGLATVSAGTLVHGSGTLRYGGKLGTRGAYRLFADSSEIGSFATPDRQNGEDDWYNFHGGFRADDDVSARDSLTAEGDAIRGNAGELAYVASLQPPGTPIMTLRNRFSEWSVLGRWKHVSSPKSETSAQFYFDRNNHGDQLYGLALNTFDIDFQNHCAWGSRHDLVWGLGYRVSRDHTDPLFSISFTPTDLTTRTFSAFIQDEIAIVPQRLYVILGTKLDHDYYNGFNVQPTARITWTPDNRQMFWAAVSEAARTPSRYEAAIRFNRDVFPEPNSLPILISVFGNRNHKNEQLVATEAGFRKQLSETLAFDATVFFNQYRDLESIELENLSLETSPQPAHLLYAYSVGNLLSGETHGLEMFARVKVASRWTLSPGYTFLAMHIHKDATSLDVGTAPALDGGSPSQQAQLGSDVNLPWHWQWTTSASFVGRLTGQNVPGPIPSAIDKNIPSYTRLDSNLSWQPSERISLTLGGQNLLKNLHQEYSGIDLTENSSLIRRSAFARITWRF